MHQPTTIHDLPAELLEEIFEDAVLSPSPDLDNNHAERRSQTALGISHVNQDWRSISRNLSTLWAGSVNPYAPPEQIEEHIRLSRSRKLTISMDTFVQKTRQATSNDDLKAQQWVTKQREKTQSFFCSAQWRALISQPNCKAPPALARCDELSLTLLPQDRQHTGTFEAMINKFGVRSLSIVSGDNEATFYLRYLGNCAVKPAFSQKLQILHLEGCIMDLAYCADSLVNLEELSVKNAPVEYAYQPQAWLRILERLPSLKRLTLSNAFGYAVAKYNSRPNCGSGSTHPPKMCFQLPNLQSFHIEEDTDDVASFLRWLDLPDQCDIEISMRDYSPTRAIKVQSVMRRFSKRYLRPKSTHCAEFSIEMGKTTIKMSSVSARKSSQASFNFRVYWSREIEGYAGWSNSATILNLIVGQGLGKKIEEAASFTYLRVNERGPKNISSACILDAIQTVSAQFDPLVSR